MTDKMQETIEDVIRKIRNEIAELRKVSPNVPSIAADWWEARADEIEACTWAKGEAEESLRAPVPTAEKSSAVGNAAKLREAVEQSKLIAESTSGLRLADDDKLRDVAKVCEAALSAPPRNCDKVKTSWDVLKKWHEGLDTANAIVRMLDWLFAPATEKEGGAK